MKVLAFPRDPNPYQELLHSELRQRGIQVRYAGCSTPYASISLILLPLELAVRRVMGFKIVHLHWVWGFQFHELKRFPFARRLAFAWFKICLATMRALGMKLAWTAHNVTPHSQVFPDDIAARRILVENCDVVFVHSEWTLDSLTELGARPAKWAAIKHPPFGRPGTRPPAPGGNDAEHTEFLFFGKIFDYKGVDDLLEAFAALPAAIPAHLTVAGECADPRLRRRLADLAERSGDRVSLRLGHIAEEEVPRLMSSADVVVLPFRRVTTSGSTLLALGQGKPLIIPGLAALGDLPSGAVFRYDGSVTGLTKALEVAGGTDGETLGRMSRAAVEYAAEATWAQLAEITAAQFRQISGRSAS